MTEQNLNQKLIKLALPMSLEGFLSASADFVDTLMVSSLGELSVSAVGLGTQLFFIQFMTVYGFCGGASTYMTQFWGAGNVSGIRKTLATTVSGALLTGIPLFVCMMWAPQLLMGIFTDIDGVAEAGAWYMTYRAPCLLTHSIILPVIMALKAMQQVRLPVACSIAAIVSNVALNYLLIFGAFGVPKMGIAGAALATTLSQALELTLLFVGMWVSRCALLQQRRDYVSLNKDLIKRVIKNAVPTTLNEMLWSGGMSAYTAAYGRISVVASAAAQAADIVAHIFTKTIYSVGDASLVLVGEQLGKSALDGAYSLSKKLLRVNLVMGLSAGGLLAALSRPIAGFFGFTDEGTRYLTILLCVYGICMALKVYNVTLITGILRAGGDVRYAMVCEVSAIWLVSVPLVFVSALVLRIPIYWVVLLAQTEDLVKAVILTRRFRSRKWAENKVKDIRV